MSANNDEPPVRWHKSMNEERKAKIITAAALDTAAVTMAATPPVGFKPSIEFENVPEEDLYKCCLIAIKMFMREKRRLAETETILP